MAGYVIIIFSRKKIRNITKLKFTKKCQFQTAYSKQNVKQNILLSTNQRITRGEAMGLSPPSDYNVLKDRKSQDFLRLKNLVDFDNGNISMRRSSSVSCIPM